jgi:DNA repair exonuclease SbcCD ATPase subunit
MSITPSGPQPEQGNTSFETAATPRWVMLVVIVLFLGLCGLLYAGYSSRQQIASDLAASNSRSDMLAKELDQTNARIADLRGKLDVTAQKLGLTEDELARARTLAQQIQKQQQDSDAQLGEQIGQVKQVATDSQQKIGQVTADLGGAKTDIAATRKDLDDTRSRLTGTIGDLGVQSGLIARNREDLEALKRLNERNIFDFNVAKSKTPQRVGPIQIALQSADPKKYRFTMTVVADDKAIQKKDRNVDEPMQFYVHGVRAPYEIVVFEVAKDHITGYLSTPKDTSAAAAEPSPAAPAKP